MEKLSMWLFGENRANLSDGNMLWKYCPGSDNSSHSIRQLLAHYICASFVPCNYIYTAILHYVWGLRRWDLRRTETSVHSRARDAWLGDNHLGTFDSICLMFDIRTMYSTTSHSQSEKYPWQLCGRLLHHSMLWSLCNCTDGYRSGRLQLCKMRLCKTWACTGAHFNCIMVYNYINLMLINIICIRARFILLL